MSKIIANISKCILPKIILENQGSFVRKRQIVENIVLIHEVIPLSRNNEENWIILKLDMENVFNCFKHRFMFGFLQKFGFNRGFIAWLSTCINNFLVSPLCNGLYMHFCVRTRSVLIKFHVYHHGRIP